VGTRCAEHVTPLYPQKLALTSPTGGGRSVGIVRVRTKATEFVLFVCMNLVSQMLSLILLIKYEDSVVSLSLHSYSRQNIARIQRRH